MQAKIAWYLIMLLFKRVRRKPAKNLKKSKSGAVKLVGILSLSGLGLGLAGLALYLYGTRVETRKYRLETLKLRTRSRTAAGGRRHDLRILHLSDLHLSGSDDHKVEFIRSITDDDYDMVVLTGDVFEFEHGIKYGEHLLSRKPRLGAYAVFGNHDYYDYSILNKTLGRVIKKLRHPARKKDVTPHARSLRQGGFTVLVNESVHLTDEDIYIVGIDYPGIARDELMGLMEMAPPQSLRLGLFHLPRKLEMLADAGFHMAFGGHTHGGQIRLPGFGALVTDSELARHEASGVLCRGETTIHISRGLGADPRSNIRLFCPPAATVIELSHYPGDSAFDLDQGDRDKRCFVESGDI